MILEQRRVTCEGIEHFMIMPSATLDSPKTATDVLALDPRGAFCLHTNPVGTLKTILEVPIPVVSVVVAHNVCQALLLPEGWRTPRRDHQKGE